MNARKLALITCALTLTLGIAADSYAEISNAAVLFLRIAPGSRAAAMGEAFVAIADDATATHWNPAGLGNYPLADTWIEANVPSRFRPIRAIASLSTGGDRNYLNYDVWAITPKGLVRYDNKHWFAEEVFDTKTDETVEQKVKGYFNVIDEGKLAGMVERVAEANNEATYEQLLDLRDQVLSNVPEDYDQIPRLEEDLDSLLVCYNLCKINWGRVREAQSELTDGLKDSALTGTECDRISVALERSKMRFLPEELKIPYDALFAGELTVIASGGDVLLVGSTDGLARYNGTNWQIISTDDGLPSGNVTALHAIGTSVLIGTDSGMAVFNGLTVDRLTTSESGLPVGEIEAIGGNSLLDIVAVVDNDLYHFDGRHWTNTLPYTIALDDTVERIASRFSLYGSSVEQQRFIEKYKSAEDREVTVEKPEPPVGAEAAGVDSTVTTAVAETETPEQVLSEEGSAADTTVAIQESSGVILEGDEALVASAGSIPGIDTPFNPGDVIRVPYLAGIRGRVTSMYVDAVERVWLGTEYGIFYLDKDHWVSPGYRDRVITEGQTVRGLALLRAEDLLGEDAVRKYLDYQQSADSAAAVPEEVAFEEEQSDTLTQTDEGDASAPSEEGEAVPEEPQVDPKALLCEEFVEEYIAQLGEINDLEGRQVGIGDTIRLPANPAANTVHSIAGENDRILFATEKGLIEYDGVEWSRSDLRGLTEADVVGINVVGDEMWIAGDEKIVVKGRGRTSINLIHVKWLPELADDLYYENLSVVTQSGWGTFGGNITFISYGKFIRTGETSPEPIGEFDSFDIAFTGSYGTSLTSRLKGGVSAKFIYSRLADQGTQEEMGSGTASGFAIDVGLLYLWTQRLTMGLAITNLGPEMTYIDAAQSDDLPRTLAFGFAYKLLQSDYNRLIVTAEANKMLVGMDDKVKQEIREMVFNGGLEFTYANLIAARGGYVFDQEGEIKIFTLGFGLTLFDSYKFDFAYIPSQEDTPLANTLRISVGVAL